MHGMNLAEPTILLHFKAIRFGPLVFGCIVRAPLAFHACECNINSHR
jgi:hypothetical protein